MGRGFLGEIGKKIPTLSFLPFILTVLTLLPTDCATYLELPQHSIPRIRTLALLDVRDYIFSVLTAKPSDQQQKSSRCFFYNDFKLFPSLHDRLQLIHTVIWPPMELHEDNLCSLIEEESRHQTTAVIILEKPLVKKHNHSQNNCQSAV